MPAGGRVIGIAGTAPGLVVETSGAVAVVLPGPPPELRRLWQAAFEDEAVRGGAGASRDARAARVARVRGRASRRSRGRSSRPGESREGVQATICAHAGEIWVELFGEGEELGGELSGRARRGDLLRGRPAGRGARARPGPRTRADARRGGVVHRRARRRAAHLGARLERRRSAAVSWRTTTRSSTLSSG